MLRTKTLFVAALLSALTAAGVSAAQAGDQLRSKSWEYSHLGAGGIAKCSAYRKIAQETRALQKGDQGRLQADYRRSLTQKLAAANAMSPMSVTPRKCGVAL